MGINLPIPPMWERRLSWPGVVHWRQGDAVERHRLQIDHNFYPLSHEMQCHLGDMYVADPRFAANYGGEAGARTYRFFVEIAGHVTDRPIVTAFDEMKRLVRDLKILGSYPSKS